MRLALATLFASVALLCAPSASAHRGVLTTADATAEGWSIAMSPTLVFQVSSATGENSIYVAEGYPYAVTPRRRQINAYYRDDANNLLAIAHITIQRRKHGKDRMGWRWIKSPERSDNAE